MGKNETLKILEDWNFWKKDLETGVKRDFYLKKLKKLLSTRQILIITGVRRSGKSFLMRQLVKELIEKGIKRNEILIVNFEDPRFGELDAQSLEEIFKVYLEFLEPKTMPYIFLDEVQEVKDWEKWVRMVHELKKAKIIISGSNARLLSKELSTLLTGRHLDLTVFPLSFKEFLDFNNFELKDKLDFARKEIDIKRFLRKYLEFGSFPEVVLEKEKKEILLKYFEDILNKDLIRRYKIRKLEKVKSLAKFYLSNISSLTTFNSAEKFLKISADTIEKFSGHFTTAYLIFFLRRFSFKVKEQEKSPRKIYAIDPGLANTIGFRFSQNIGRLAENAVFLELKRRQALDSNLELYYWKDERHLEVDFVLKYGLKAKELIQVCWNLNPQAKGREVKALIKAAKEFGLKSGLIITSDQESEEKIQGLKISFVPLWKFLLK